MQLWRQLRCPNRRSSPHRLDVVVEEAGEFTPFLGVAAAEAEVGGQDGQTSSS